MRSVAEKGWVGGGAVKHEGTFFSDGNVLDCGGGSTFVKRCQSLDLKWGCVLLLVYYTLKKMVD